MYTVAELLLKLEISNYCKLDLKVNDDLGSDWLLNCDLDFVLKEFGAYKLETYKFKVDNMDSKTVRLIIICEERK